MFPIRPSHGPATRSRLRTTLLRSAALLSLPRLSLPRAATLAVASAGLALAPAIVQFGDVAWAGNNGGDGGGSGTNNVGGSGGVGSTGGFGGSGGDGGVTSLDGGWKLYGGGGGGGAGWIGGQGGATAADRDDHLAGGGNGHGRDGQSASSSQWGLGGGGGAHGYSGSNGPNNATGGNGGIGGQGGVDTANQTYFDGGGGGAGGYGFAFTGLSSTTVGTVIGGGGGRGGDATGSDIIVGGDGGAGGHGLFISAQQQLSITLDGLAQGGSGGAAGTSSGNYTAQAGANGSGIVIAPGGNSQIGLTIGESAQAKGGSGGNGTGGAGITAYSSNGFAGPSINVKGSVTGGAGGADKVAGPGGAGIVVIGDSNHSTIDVHGTVTGGAGDVGVAGAVGGTGIVGGNLSVYVYGTVSGGTGDGGTAPAITFTGGWNTLALFAGSTINGTVTAASTNDLFLLAGSTAGSFDAGSFGPNGTFVGFGTVQTSGAAIWQLTGTGELPSTLITTGGLELTQANVKLGQVTVNNGTFAVSAQPGSATVNNLTVNAGGTFSIAEPWQGNYQPVVLIDTLTMASGSTLSVTLANDHQRAPTVGISGTATFDNTTLNVVDAGMTGGSYVLIANDPGGMSGTFTYTAPPGYDYNLSITGQGLVLDVTPIWLKWTLGNGNWNKTNADWLSYNNAENLVWNGQTAVFDGPGGTVTLNGKAGDISVQGLQFTSDGYTVTGDPLVLASPTGSVSVSVSDGSAEIDAPLTGTSGLTMNGPGKLILAGASTFTGNTVIANGTIQLGNGTLTGTLTSDIVNNGTLAFAEPGATTVANTISGSGSVVQNGPGTVTLSGANSFTGGVSIESGTLVAASATALGTADGGTTVSANATLALAGGIAIGAEPVTLSGHGTNGSGALMNQSGTNSLAGPITLAATTLITAASGELTLSGGIGGNFDLAFAGAGNGVVSGDIATGASTVLVTGGGSWTLTGANSFQDGLWVANGSTVSVAADTALGASSGTVLFDDGTLAVTNGFASVHTFTIGGSGGVFDIAAGQTLTVVEGISGAGSLSLSGGGQLSLFGKNVLSGAVDVASDTLDLGQGATLSSAGVTVGAGGNLTGDGRILGPVTVGSGGNLSGALETGALTLQSGSTTTLALSAGTRAVAAVSGDLSATTALDLAGAPENDSGYYRLFTYTGALSEDITVAEVPAGYSASIDTATRGRVDVVLTDGSTLQAWTAGAARPAGGDGVWDATSASWYDVTKGTVGNWAGEKGVFTGAAGTVDVRGTHVFDTLEFASSGYVLIADPATPGSGLELTGAGRVWVEGAETTATIDVPIAGTGGLTKTGAGTLVLEGDNSFQGGTRVRAGTLAVSRDANLGAASGGITLDGGTLAATASFSSAREVTVGPNGGGLNVAGGATLGLSGTIEGSGQLTKTGAGTLLLTGTAAPGGGTRIEDGTLQVGDGGSTGWLSGAIVDEARLVYALSGTYALPAALSGSGELVIASGTATYAGSAFAGTLQLAGGDLVLASGATSAATFVVGSGSTLSGSGTVGALDVESGGRLSPGYSPGTLNITGNAAFASGSTFVADMTASGAHDLVAAGGSATIENGAVLDVVAAPGLYHAGMAPVTVLTAAGGITGSFTTVLTNLAFLAPDMSYGTDAVTFTLERNGVAFADEANTANERAVAAAVESLGPGNSLYDAIVSQESGASAPAFNALSGEIYASTSTVIQQQSTYVRDAVGERLRQAFAPAGTGEPADGPATAALGPNLAPIMWMQGFGGWGDTSGNGNAASVSNSIGGAIGGIDAAVAEGWRLGVYGGYSYSTFDVDGRDSQGTMNSYDLGVYAGTRAGAFTARFGGGYAWHDVDVSRTIAFDGYSASAHSDATVGSGQLFAEAGYDIALTALGAPPATKGVLQPFVGLAYVHVDGATFAEGSGAAELSTREEDMSTTYSTLGVRLSGTVEIGGRELRPELTLGWQHAFGDITPQATAQFTGSNVGFTVSGVPVAEDAALVGVGLAYAISPLADISLRYTGQLASDAQQSNVAARLSIRF